MRFLSIPAVLFVLCISNALAQDKMPPAGPPTGSGPISSVELRIASARKRAKTAPNSQSYNDLAFALYRQGRDTGAAGVYAEASAVLKRSLELEPGNYQAAKLQAALYLETQEPTKALKLATELNRRVPDDIANWGLLVDANLALGNYGEAERDAQWILDLRPGSELGFEKAAALREVFGDFEGSIEFFDEADLRTSPNDADQRAWHLTRKADLELASGNAGLAEQVITQALRLFPDSQLALATLAKIRARQGRSDEAASLLRNRYDKVKSLSNLYSWAEALAKSSDPKAATPLFRQFEAAAQAEIGKPGNTDVDLIFFYLNQRDDPAKALSVAATRGAEYRDSRTLDALAWALYSSGRYSEARIQMDRALAVGVRNSFYFCHAAQIAAKLNDADAVRKYRKDLTDLAPNSCPEQSITTAVREGAQ